MAQDLALWSVHVSKSKIPSPYCCGVESGPQPLHSDCYERELLSIWAPLSNFRLPYEAVYQSRQGFTMACSTDMQWALAIASHTLTGIFSL